MEDLSLKTNFIGRDGFVWWIGQIPLGVLDIKSALWDIIPIVKRN
jgi:hypothetical protein